MVLVICDIIGDREGVKVLLVVDDRGGAELLLVTDGGLSLACWVHRG